MVGFLSVVYSGFRTNHRVPSILKRITMENVANAIQCYLSKFPPKSIFEEGCIQYEASTMAAFTQETLTSKSKTHLRIGA